MAKDLRYREIVFSPLHRWQKLNEVYEELAEKSDIEEKELTEMFHDRKHNMDNDRKQTMNFLRLPQNETKEKNEELKESLQITQRRQRQLAERQKMRKVRLHALYTGQRLTITTKESALPSFTPSLISKILGPNSKGKSLRTRGEVGVNNFWVVLTKVYYKQRKITLGIPRENLGNFFL